MVPRFVLPCDSSILLCVLLLILWLPVRFRDFAEVFVAGVEGFALVLSDVVFAVVVFQIF